MHEKMSNLNFRRQLVNILVFCIPFLVVFAGWQIVTSANLIAPLFLPAPKDIVTQFGELFRDGEIIQPLFISLYRAFAGMLLALVSGTIVGILMARNRWCAWFFEPLISLGFPAPKIVLIPLFILYFGIGDLSKIILVMLTCMFPVIIVVQQATASLNKVLIWSAQSMGTPERALLRRIVWPAITPAIFTSIRITLPAALITTFTCEMVAGGGGLGAALMFAQRFFETPTVYVYITLMLVIGVILDRLLLWMRSYLMPWVDDQS